MLTLKVVILFSIQFSQRLAIFMPLIRELCSLSKKKSTVEKSRIAPVIDYVLNTLTFVRNDRIFFSPVSL